MVKTNKRIIFTFTLLILFHFSNSFNISNLLFLEDDPTEHGPVKCLWIHYANFTVYDLHNLKLPDKAIT